MENDIFTPKQQEKIAKAIKLFFELHDMTASSPRENAKESANKIFRDLVGAAGSSGILEVEDLQGHALQTGWLVEFLDALGNDDILLNSGVSPARLKPSHEALIARLKAA